MLQKLQQIKGTENQNNRIFKLEWEKGKECEIVTV